MHIYIYTRDPFVYSGIVNWSILLLAFNTSFIATPPRLDIAKKIAQHMVSSRPLCFAIQHTILLMAISCKGHVEYEWSQLGLCKRFFYFEASVHESIILLLPPHLHCLPQLQCSCTSITQGTTSPRPSFCVPYTIQYW